MKFLRIGVAAIYCGACLGVSAEKGSMPVNIRYIVTDMSVVGPELQILLENNSTSRMNFRLQPDRLVCTGQQPEVEKLSQIATYERERPWHIRREMLLPTNGSIPAGGVVHRIYAFGHIDERFFPCDVHISVITDGKQHQLIARVDRQTRAPLLWLHDPPVVRVFGWVDKDLIGERILAHVIVESSSDKELNVAVLERTIACPVNHRMHWDLIQDVPQGLSAGPARLVSSAWLGFLGVIYVGDFDSAVDCTIEIELGYEVTPTGFAALTSIRIPVIVQPGMTWN